MAKRYAKKTTKVYRKRKTAVKRFTRTLNAMRGNTAEVVETTPSTFLGSAPGTLTANKLYLAQVHLAQYARALSVSKSYRFYRIRTVKYVYKPNANLFVVGGVVVPQLYTIMNRSGDVSTFNLDDLKDQGSKPRQFTKPLNVKYSPSTVISVSDTPTGDVSAMLSGSKKWLSTDDVNVPYWGHYFWVDYPTALLVEYGRLDIEIEVDFKEPNVVASGTELPTLQGE